VSVDEKTLKSYAGQYGARLVTFADGRLWYQRAADAGKTPMLSLSATDFAMAEGQRVRFVASAGAVELRLLNPDGTHVPYLRQD
jgi:hypothetical protein